MFVRGNLSPGVTLNICRQLTPLIQVTLKNHASGEEKILFLNSEQEKDKTLYTDQVLFIFWKWFGAKPPP